MWYEFLIDKGLLPRSIVQSSVRYMLKRYLSKYSKLSDSEISQIQNDFCLKHSYGPVAKSTGEANIQHYEFPIEFFKTVLGPKLKYSGSFFNKEDSNLENAELNSLEKYTQYAELKNGESILELGCGWGSLSLYIATNFPNIQITSITNSIIQYQYINEIINLKKLNNIQIVHSNMNEFNPKKAYDKIISIEMFEHMYNTKKLLELTYNWLKPEGSLFFQVFSHRSYPQDFDQTDTSWMAKYFFTHGMMPYDRFYNEINSNFILDKSWIENGKHYSKTLYAWLENLDNNYLKLLNLTHNNSKLLNRWKLFFIICGELFAYNDGTEWYIKQYLLKKEQKNNK